MAVVRVSKQRRAHGDGSEPGIKGKPAPTLRTFNAMEARWKDRLATLEVILLEFGRHLDDCATRDGGDCTCGWRRQLVRLRTGAHYRE